MLTYKLIKRKYKLTDTNVAGFFGYKNRISFFTSSGKDVLITYLERVYDQYVTGGLKAATHYANVQGLSSKKRDGLMEFIDTINFQHRKGAYIDPEKGPRANMIKYRK